MKQLLQSADAKTRRWSPHLRVPLQDIFLFYGLLIITEVTPGT